MKTQVMNGSSCERRGLARILRSHSRSLVREAAWSGDALVAGFPGAHATRASRPHEIYGPGRRSSRFAPAGLTLTFTLILTATAMAAEAPRAMVLVPAGAYAPLLRSNAEAAEIPVRAFLLDEQPVTNAEFLAFVRENPKWRRSRTARIFADRSYLADWAGDLELGPRAPADSPVVRVSWFAARAYAAWTGKRLPTIAEWERAAAAGFQRADGRNEPGYLAGVLAWYSEPTPAVLPAAGAGRPNVFGARDLLNLVWEWVDDFGAVMVTGDARNGGGKEFFCGGAAANSRDPSDYPAFMRMGYRSSLRANYTVANLGFRCAKDLADQDLPPQASANP